MSTPRLGRAFYVFYGKIECRISKIGGEVHALSKMST